MAPRLGMGHHQLAHGRQIVALAACGTLGRRGLADDRAMGASAATDARSGPHRIRVGLGRRAGARRPPTTAPGAGNRPRSCTPRVLLRPWWGATTAVPGRPCVPASWCCQTGRGTVSVPQRLAPLIGACPSAGTTAGGKRAALRRGPLGIKLCPVGVDAAPAQGGAGGVGGAFPSSAGGLRLTDGDRSVGEIDGRAFRHRRAWRIVHAADQHADGAHGVRRDPCGCPIGAHLERLPVVTCPETYSRLPKSC